VYFVPSTEKPTGVSEPGVPPIAPPLQRNRGPTEAIEKSAAAADLMK
jgi:hypothetical protein